MSNGRAGFTSAETSALAAQAVVDESGCDKDCLKVRIGKGHHDLGVGPESGMRRGEVRAAALEKIVEHPALCYGEAIVNNEDSLLFTCGLVVKTGTIVVPAQYASLPGEQMSRVAFCFDGNWVYHDVDNDVVGAICFRRSDNSLWMLGRNGNLRHVTSGAADFTLDNIRGKFENHRIETDRLGELLCIREIENELYICGQSSQVYRHSNGAWTNMSPPDANVGSPTLESLDGLSHDDLYAVGEKGLILHHDGSRWSALDSPTDRPLSCVRCKSGDEVYACGNDGLLLVGNRNGWHVINTGRTMNFWDMALYDGHLYLSHARGLVRYDGQDFFDVDMGLAPPPGAHKLDARDGRLYSFGVDDILTFDGNRWERLLCPHNT